MNAELKTKMPLAARLSATGLFVVEAVFRPHQIGALLPSSQHLSNAMARWLPLDTDAYALELGPGTGSVTEALLLRGLRQDRLIAIEKSPKMADLLRARYPRARIITGDAFQVDTLLKTHVPEAHNISTVFCSLPLRNFRAYVADDLARKLRALLPAGGRLVQYTYRIASGPPKAAAHFRPVVSRVVWLNFPPARVSVYQK
jgi:phosphatidylethanolamine/phosphatidyl-N-methylethanolamine N-methyltransferase